MALQVELVSPERILYSGEAEMVDRPHRRRRHRLPVRARAVRRRARHRQGRRSATVGGTSVVAAVHGGFVEIKDNRVSILSDVAELSTQIDVARARDALSRAGDDEDARRRAEVRLDAAGETSAAAH